LVRLRRISPFARKNKTRYFSDFNQFNQFNQFNRLNPPEADQPKIDNDQALKPMFEKLKGVEKRYSEIEKRLGDPEIIKDQQVYQDLIREHADLKKIVTVYR
jgi:hypothetical protein